MLSQFFKHRKQIPPRVSSYAQREKHLLRTKLFQVRFERNVAINIATLQLQILQYYNYNVVNTRTFSETQNRINIPVNTQISNQLKSKYKLILLSILMVIDCCVKYRCGSVWRNVSLARHLRNASRTVAHVVTVEKAS